MEQEHLYYVLRSAITEANYAKRLVEEGINEENIQVAIELIQKVNELKAEFDRVLAKQQEK